MLRAPAHEDTPTHPQTVPRMRWWGWGVDGHDPEIGADLAALLEHELGVDPAARRPPVPLESLAHEPSRLPPDVRGRLEEIVGEPFVRSDRVARIAHAAGRSYPDLIRLRTGDALHAPDAVVYPGSAAEIAAILELCGDARVAVIPFGGGTSVVGGVDALRGRFAVALTLDLTRLDRPLDIDPRALTATLEAGMTGPAVEAALAEHDLTLGHFPQSFEFSTLGGWVATRSAGQASTGYGRIDDLVLGLRCVAPAGDLVALPAPSTGAGPDLRRLILGSEGTLGVITEATLRVRPRPETRRYEGWSLPSFGDGVDALREVAQHGCAPVVARLSDAAEARLAPALQSRADALATFGWEGDERAVRSASRAASRLMRRHGGVPLGTAPGRAWERGRFAGPYLRDALLGAGVLVDTLETAVGWSRLEALYHRVGGALRDALAACGTPGYVMCHISHVYATGASLYFTFVARQERGAELEQWRVVKSAGVEAIVGEGATITHHHAIGRDHAPWLEHEIGPLGLGLLRGAKAAVDPAGIMNPGKLVDG